MRRSGRGDLILVALLLSAAVHIGMMIWARPKVMTEVTAGVPGAQRRGPMKVSRSVAEPDPVKIAVVRDVAPEKNAPTVDETVALLPAAVPSLPAAPEQTVSPAEAAAAKVIEKSIPETAAPVFEMPAAAKAPALGAGKMDVESPKSIIRASGTLADLVTPRDAPQAPAFQAPIFGTSPQIREIPAREKMTKKDESAETPKPVFKPPEEVMERVDEKIVEAEKQSVRDLLDVEQAADIKTRVDVALEAFMAGGYTYFRATVSPKPSLQAVPKDIVVILDASGSVGWDRLTSCRKAAREILRTATNTGDRFNIVAFRDRFAYAFRNWRPCDAESFAAGDRWLSKLGAHGRTDVFSTIASILTLPRDPARPLIALVVTDGEANSGVSETSQILARFSKLNDGLVSVYMYGVKSSANRELIDVLTRGNRGESFIFEGWRWKAGEGIGPLSERFRDPILTDMRVVFPSVCPAEAYPVRLKNVYRGNTMTITGRVAGSPGEISFSLRGLAGKEAFEGYYRLNAGLAKQNAELPKLWQAEQVIDGRLR